MSTNLELEAIEGECPSCKKIGTFYYAGTQEGFKGVDSFGLYNCQACHSTLSDKTISSYNSGLLITAN